MTRRPGPAWLVLAALAGCNHDFTVLGDGPEPTPDVPPPGACELPYQTVLIAGTPRSGCYRVVSTLATWFAAEADCENDAPDSHLVVIDDVPEHDTIHDLIDESWVGYTDVRTEGTSLWVTASGGVNVEADSCFFGSIPNQDGIDCALQRTRNCPDWIREVCTASHGYVCERDGKPADPARY